MPSKIPGQLYVFGRSDDTRTELLLQFAAEHHQEVTLCDTRDMAVMSLFLSHNLSLIPVLFTYRLGEDKKPIYQFLGGYQQARDYIATRSKITATPAGAPGAAAKGSAGNRVVTPTSEIQSEPGFTVPG